MLMRIFGPRRDEVTGEWRKMHNEKIHDLFSSASIVQSDKIEKNEMKATCREYGGKQCSIKGFHGET